MSCLWVPHVDSIPTDSKFGLIRQKLENGGVPLFELFCQKSRFFGVRITFFTAEYFFFQQNNYFFQQNNYFFQQNNLFLQQNNIILLFLV